MNKSGLKKLACTLLAAGLFAAAAPAAPAAGAVRRTVRVAFPVQSGMSEVGESGDLQGYNHSYLLDLAEYVGWDVEYVTYAPGDEGIMEAMQQVADGEADLVGPMLRSDAVEEMFEFPENNYGVVYTTLCALERDNLTSLNFMHLNPLRVAVYAKATTRNEEVAYYLDQLGIQYELVECESTEAQMQALETGKADVLSSITLSYFEGTRSVAQFAPRPYYFVTAKGNTALMEELDEAVEKLNYTRPTLQEELQEEYFGNTSGGYFLTESEAAYMEGLDTLNVLCVANYAPYCARGQDGSPGGVLVSLLNDFAADNGVQVHYEFCEDAADEAVQWETGRYDCVIGLPFTSEYCTQQGLIRTDSVITTNMEIYGKSQTKDYASSSVALYGHFSDGMNLGNFAETQFYPSLTECFAAVNSGKADYGCANQLSVDYEIFSNGYPFNATPLMGQQLEICVAVDKEMDSRFLSALNKYIITLPENTVTAYLSEATRHKDIDSFALFVRSQPVTAALMLAAALVLLVIVAVLLLNARKRKRWNAELREANDRMREATAAKSEFLSRMSHDIRTPMNAILGFAELGRQDANSPDLLREDLEKISSSGEFLLGLVNDILDISKIESKAMTLKPEPYAKTDFEAQLKTLVGPLCEAKHITFASNFSADTPPCLLVDKLRFNQIFFNLLSNAVKFTPEGGKIEIGGRVLGRQDGRVQMEFVVADNGVGMSEEFQKHMFESFAQEEQHIDNTRGSGLGLSIVKSLVELMDGSIRVESRPGAGSRFILMLAAPECALPQQEAAAQGPAYGEALAGKKVLLVEDHPVNRRLAGRMLENVGVQVTFAENGKLGVEAFADSPIGFFDDILMDIRMPVMDGIEATRAIRALARADAGTVPIVAVTANAFDDDIKQCEDAGMTAHLSKPFEMEKLYAVLAGE